jgi:DNA-binding NarL/FixJ family response regulator
MVDNWYVNTASPNPFKLKVLLVEDDLFTQQLVTDVLEHRDIEVRSVSDVANAIDELESFEPNVVVTDLDLGDGPDGSDLLQYIDLNLPWIGKVVLTSHSSPTLALSPGQTLPNDITLLIRPRVSTNEIHEAVLAALEHANTPRNMSLEIPDEIRLVSQAQGELLKLMAEGLSNTALARHRNRSIQATEAMVHRLFLSLGIVSHPDVNPRVVAVRMWQQGKVRVK